MWWERIWSQIRYLFLISPRYKDSYLISSFVHCHRYLAWFFQKTQNYYWNRWNQGKMGDTDNSDFGSDGGGKNCICHVIPNALRVPKMYILSMLEISRVITIPIILWIAFTAHLNGKNLSTNSSWDFDGVLDTMDPYWFVPDEQFSPSTSGSRWRCNSLQQVFQKVLKMKNGYHFQAKKTSATLDSVSEIFLRCTVFEIWIFCRYLPPSL